MNPIRYCDRYRSGCGRECRLEAVWGDRARYSRTKLEESAEINSDIATHASDFDAHDTEHTPYTDPEFVECDMFPPRIGATTRGAKTYP
jgi:hypothetical protein